MAEYVYTTVPGKIGNLLAKIREVGVPSKATNAWLKTIGFTSSNDGSLIPILKYVGFIDASNVPTETWAQYRGAKHRQILGHAIREGYAELYAIYPNAHDQSVSDLENVFSTSSKGGKQVISKLVSTFRGLAEQADFTNLPESSSSVEAPATHAPIAQAAPQPPSSNSPESANPSLHIDLQIHISPESSPEQIDQIFASMSKHLYNKKK